MKAARRALGGLALLGLALGTTPARAATAAGERLADRVVLLANRDDAASVRIARHYAEVRGVPPDNVVVLPMPRVETISWREFVATIWEPLRAQLVAQRWIEATSSSLVDPVGRRKYAPSGHRIAALVVCRGVPLRIAHDPQLLTEVAPLTKRAEFRTNAGAVDSELSLLATANQPVTAFAANPLFQNDRPTALQLGEVVKVSRLDGPTADDANALVDRAVAAERTGLLGRAYVDLAQRDPKGDGMLEAAARLLLAEGFDCTVDREQATLPATARFDAPVLYFGWYAADLDGPFALPGFRFPPGAIALHIHSFSAATLRDPARGWTGPLVARGVTATVGNVYEPYLELTHRPDLFVRALIRGDTLADAAYYALQPLSWQAVLVGDPLYRPFAVSLDEQVENFSRLPAPLAGYAVLRRMRQLEAAGRAAEATALAASSQASRPNLAVGMALARHYRETGDASTAGAALAFAGRVQNFAPAEWALVREAAQLLGSVGRTTAALRLWRTLLAVPEIPRGVRVAWLPDATATAIAAGDSAQAEAWRSEHAQFSGGVGK